MVIMSRNFYFISIKDIDCLDDTDDISLMSMTFQASSCH